MASVMGDFQVTCQTGILTEEEQQCASSCHLQVGVPYAGSSGQPEEERTLSWAAHDSSTVMGHSHGHEMNLLFHQRNSLLGQQSVGVRLLGFHGVHKKLSVF